MMVVIMVVCLVDSVIEKRYIADKNTIVENKFGTNVLMNKKPRDNVNLLHTTADTFEVIISILMGRY